MLPLVALLLSCFAECASLWTKLHRSSLRELGRKQLCIPALPQRCQSVLVCAHQLCVVPHPLAPHLPRTSARSMGSPLISQVQKHSSTYPVTTRPSCAFDSSKPVILSLTSPWPRPTFGGLLAVVPVLLTSVLVVRLIRVNLCPRVGAGPSATVDARFVKLSNWPVSSTHLVLSWTRARALSKLAQSCDDQD